MTASMLSRRGPPPPQLPVLPWLSSNVHRDQHRDISRTDTRTEAASEYKNEYDHGTEGEDEEDDDNWACLPPAPPAKKRKLDRCEQGLGPHHGLKTHPTTRLKTTTTTTTRTASSTICIRVRKHPLYHPHNVTNENQSTRKTRWR